MNGQSFITAEKAEKPLIAFRFNLSLTKGSKMSEWHPIETAPKDGTRVMIFVPEFDPQQYVAEYGSTADLPKDHEDYWEGWCFSDEILINHCKEEPEPTHWMHLPLPPTL